MEIGDRVKKVREHMGVSQKDFSVALKASQGVMSDIERSKKDISRNLLVNLIIRYPDVNMNWLLTGRGEMFLAPPTIGERLVYLRHHFKMEKEGWALLASLSTEELENYETNKDEPPGALLDKLEGNYNANPAWILTATDPMLLPPSITDKKPVRTPLTVDDGFKEALPDVYALYRENRKLKEKGGTGQAETFAVCEIMKNLNSVRREKVDDFARWQLKEQEAEYTAEQANSGMAG